MQVTGLGRARRQTPPSQTGQMTRYHAEYAWLGGDTADREVRIEVADGRITAVQPGAPPDGTRLPGLTLPGLANAHSHAFHRALRGRTQSGRGTFWTWREQMYALAGHLDPDGYYRLARATYGEMVLAGITCVGEFHYLHHAPGGTRYADPNAMGHALLAAARDAGLRITLLDTVYLTSTVDGAPLTGPQLRFGDGSLDAWAARVGALRPEAHAVIGGAAHSVRAVPAGVLGAMAVGEGPFHIHLSEQRAENEACRARYGGSPSEVLHEAGLLGEQTTVVHATHLSDEDRTLLGDTRTRVCFCPTTERELADGIGPAADLATAGSPLCLGSDSHAVIDLFEEARAVELDERLRTEHRGHFTAAELLGAATGAGHLALGWTDAGRLAPGYRADLVTVTLDSVRTVGAQPLPAAVFAATAADVTHVLVDGVPTVTDGRHRSLDVPRELREALP
jgi:formiminoglutamate deiminase